jgi:hypothetical protein
VRVGLLDARPAQTLGVGSRPWAQVGRPADCTGDDLTWQNHVARIICQRARRRPANEIEHGGGQFIMSPLQPGGSGRALPKAANRCRGPVEMWTRAHTRQDKQTGPPTSAKSLGSPGRPAHHHLHGCWPALKRGANSNRAGPGGRQKVVVSPSRAADSIQKSVSASRVLGICPRPSRAPCHALILARPCDAGGPGGRTGWRAA